MRDLSGDFTQKQCQLYGNWQGTTSCETNRRFICSDSFAQCTYQTDEVTGCGEDYKYSHDFPGDFGHQEFFPDDLVNYALYEPGGSAREKQTKDFLRQRWQG